MRNLFNAIWIGIRLRISFHHVFYLCRQQNESFLFSFINNYLSCKHTVCHSLLLCSNSTSFLRYVTYLVHLFIAVLKFIWEFFFCFVSFCFFPSHLDRTVVLSRYFRFIFTLFAVSFDSNFFFCFLLFIRSAFFHVLLQFTFYIGFALHCICEIAVADNFLLFVSFCLAIGREVTKDLCLDVL